MKAILVLLTPMILLACGNAVPPNAAPNDTGQLYTKIDLTQLHTCSLTNACTTVGDSCVTYTKDKSYCYPEGHESEIVGCTKGSLILDQSYPAHAACK